MSNDKLKTLCLDWCHLQACRTHKDNTRVALKWYLIGRGVRPEAAHVLAFHLDIFSMELL